MEQINLFYEYLPMNRLGQVMYPYYFGGMYIDEEGNLVVLQVESPYDSEIGSRFSDDIIVKMVEFSYNEIMMIHNQLTRIFTNEYLKYPNLAGSWTDIINNRVVVTLFEYNDEAISNFKENVSQSPLIVFEEYEILNLYEESYLDKAESMMNNYSQITPLNNVTVSPGDTIRMGSSTGGRCSVGFRVGNRGVRGFVIAAHCGGNGTRVYNASGRHIGTVRSRFLEHIDASFVEINANVNVGSVLPYAVQLAPVAATPVVGQIIISRGAINGMRSGLISRVNYNTTITGVGTITNALRTTLIGSPGDSGGVAFSRFNGQIHHIQGIVIGGQNNANGIVSRTSEITRRTGWNLQ